MNYFEPLPRFFAFLHVEGECLFELLNFIWNDLQKDQVAIENPICIYRQ